MLSGRSCSTFEVSSFAEIETWEKEPSLQNTGGGGSTETEMGGRRKKRVQENWTPWKLLGACSGQVQRKARREKGKGRYPRLRPAQTHMKGKSKL